MRATSDLGACTVSDESGTPGASEKRNMVGTAWPSNSVDFVYSAASGLAVRVPAPQKPFAWTAR